MVNKVRARHLSWGCLIFILIIAACYTPEPPEPDKILEMAWQSDRYLWTGGVGWLARWDTLAEKNDLYHNETGVPFGKGKFFVARDNTIWALTSEQVYHFSDTTRHVFSAKHGLRSHLHTAFIELADGQILLGSQGELERYDPTDMRWYPLTLDTSFGNVTALLEASDGAIWIGTARGIVRWDGQSAQVWTVEDGLSSDYVMTLLEARDGTIWVGTAEGVSRWDGQAWGVWTDPTGGPAPGEPFAENRSIDTLLETRDGAIWATTWKGVSRWDGHSWQTWTERDGLGDWRVKCLLEAQDGTIWAGTFGGVSRWDGKRWHTYTTEDGLGANNVTVLLESPDGTLWAGTFGGGINWYDPEMDYWEPFPSQ